MNNCNHDNSGINNGTYWGWGCPYCQPKCPYCGRPYVGWNPSYPIYWSQPTCGTPTNLGEAKEPTL